MYPFPILVDITNLELTSRLCGGTIIPKLEGDNFMEVGSYWAGFFGALVGSVIGALLVSLYFFRTGEGE